jgi:mRNA interferase MazF
VEGVKRGDLVTVAIGGDYGKPRPALVIQADAFAALPSVTVLRLTSEIHAEHLVRVTVPPTAENGLRTPSQIMIDKAVTVPRVRIGRVIGHLDDALMRTVGQALAAFFGLDTTAAESGGA